MRFVFSAQRHAGHSLLTFLQTHEATEGVFQLGDSEFAKV
jgi:hypothetical protein